MNLTKQQIEHAHEIAMLEYPTQGNLQAAYELGYLHGIEYGAWINVEDELPEDGQIVLANVHHTIDGAGEHHEDDMFVVERYDCKWCTDRKNEHKLLDDTYECISKVTYWMPLSNPTKEKEVIRELQEMCKHLGGEEKK